MRTTSEASALHMRLRPVSSALAWFSFVLGALVLVGWLLDVSWLKSVVAGFASMKANTALAFVSGGLAVRLHLAGRPRIGMAVGIAVTVLAALTLSQDIFRTDLGIDQLLFADDPAAAGTGAPGRMAPATAIGFVVTGLAIVALGARRAVVTAQLLSLLAISVGGIGLAGYLLDVRNLYGEDPFTWMAVHTSVGLIVLNLAIAIAHPKAGLIKPLAGRSAGALVARRLLPLAFSLPVGLGLALVLGVRAGLFGPPFAMALAAVGTAIVLFGLIWWTAHAVERVELRVLEERNYFETTLASIGDAVIVIDERGRVSFMNPVAEQLTGWTFAEASGRPLEDVFVVEHEETGAPIDNPVKKAIQSRTVVGLANHAVLVARDGRRRSVEDSAAPVQDEEGVLHGAVLVFRDITTRRSQERELTDKTATLEAEDRRKDVFLATLGHELRNPLAALDSAVKLMDQGAGDMEAIHGVMRNQVAQLTALVNDLLEVSRITRGKLTLRKQSVDMTEVARAAADAVAGKVRKKDQELSLSLPDSLPVEADPTRIEQVISNLLSNASKYTPEGGHIRLDVRPDGDEVVLTVRDDGRGIAPAQLQRVFEPFMQGDTASGGLGIGLSLVRGLVGLHGGTVLAASDGVGHGAEFTVRIPRGRPAVGSAESRTPELEPFDEALQILIVDDVRDAADSMALVLERLGAETRCAYTGAEGLEVADEFRPDVALIDIGLPDLSGYEVAERLRAFDGRCLLIAVTGFGDDATGALAHEAGFAARLVKPIDYRELRRLIVQHRDGIRTGGSKVR